MGALLMGVSRPAAAEFSFMLAIPTMFGATTYDLYKNRDALTVDSVTIVAVGFIAAFLVAMVVVKWVMRYISTHGFGIFAIYRIILGVVMLGILAAR
jgi:undecaprenyl-diphosphatase